MVFDECCQLYSLDLIDFEEFALVMAKQMERIRVPKQIFRFNLNRYSKKTCIKLFRFNKTDLHRLARCLQLEKRLLRRNGYIFHGKLATINSILNINDN
jgi:hypothetical protein